MNQNADIQMPEWLSEVTFDAQGLLPAIAQDHQTGRLG